MRDILFSSGIKVIYAEYVVSLFNEALAKMRAQESSAASHQDSLHVIPLERPNSANMPLLAESRTARTNSKIDPTPRNVAKVSDSIDASTNN